MALRPLWKLILVQSLVILMVFILGLSVNAAYLRNVPQTLTQPNGEILNCFASGDEFFNWLHDERGFVIIEDPITGYYVYAQNIDGKMVPTHYIAGKVDPQSVGLSNKITVNRDKILQLKKNIFPVGSSEQISNAPTSGTINNIVIFIRFSGETEYSDQLQLYNSMFNTGTTSMHNYFLEASYNQLTVNTTFYPVTGGSTVISYQDSHVRNYFKPYNSITAPQGYSSEGERKVREQTLLKDAINTVGSQISGTLDIDGDDDGKVDNICFIISGSTTAWSTLLWPHKWTLDSYSVYINGIRVWNYNFQLRDFLQSYGSGVLCHEMFHSLGSPDLYHYYYSTDLHPVYKWDIMEYNTNPPQHMGAYMKNRYGKWISSLPEITDSGIYTLHPVTSSSNNCYKIASPNSSTEFFLVEYRKKTGSFESSLPGSGLLIYRINTDCDGDGNSNGPPDEVYIFRPNGTLNEDGYPGNAYFSSEAGRTVIDDGTNPALFLYNDGVGGNGGFRISNIGSASGSTISFQVQLNKLLPPTFNKPPGTYNIPQVVTISCPAEGATIRYTTDGSEPTELSNIFTGPITISSTTTLKAKVFRNYDVPSDTKWVKYTINTGYPESTHEYACNLDYTWTYKLEGTHSSINVTFDHLTKVESDYDYIYIMDGEGNNITGSPFTGDSLAGQIVNITGSTIKIRLVSDHSIVFYGFRVSKIIDGSGPMDTPALSPEGGTYTSSQSVTISCAMPEATIRYTMDGTDPNSGSPTISSGSSITVRKSLTLKAKAWKTGWESSSIKSASFVVNVATPTISPDGGLFTAAQRVTVSCDTPGVSIRYTTNGSNPNTSSAIVVSGSTIPVSSTMTLKVKAWKTGCVTSPVKSSSFTITGTVSKPAFSPAAGTYGAAQSVKITCATVGATIRYTTDGSEPATDNGQVISSGSTVLIKTTTNLKAKAWKTDWATSGTKTALYTITSVAKPDFNPGGGAYGAPQTVTISCATPDVEIHYTTNGNDPTTGDPVITSGDSILVDHTMTLKAKAWKTGLAASGVKSAVYTF
jgi:M6 family metalloprotease-like protein